MIHRGEIVEKAVRESAYPITALADKLGKSRRHIYNMFDNNRLNWDTIKEIGRIIHHDFSIEFEELRLPDHPVLERNPIYLKDLNACEQEVNYWKNKYIELLEKYSEALILQVEKPKYSNNKKTGKG